MKTKPIHLVLVLLLACFSNNLFSQDLFKPLSETNFDFQPSISESLDTTFDPFKIGVSLDTTNFLEEQDPEQLAAFARTMLALGVGFGFDSSQTLWCLHASYYIRLAMYTNSALYGSLGAVYNGISSDNLSSSLVDFQLKMLMFHAITRYNQVHFIYGALLAYGLGSDKYNGNSTDITRTTAALVLGFNIILTTQLAIMLQTNIFAYQSQTSKPNGGNEFKSNNTWGLINKNNLLALSLVLTL